MDCREAQTLLNAFHDGELPAADRARVEEHLRGCPPCAALLADLARVDQAAGVPDPGPAYWDRFNARVMDRVEREADGPRVAVLRPKDGWMRQQLRYLVPAAAAAALVVMIVRYGGVDPGAPTPLPKAMDGQVPGQAGMPPAPPPRPPAVNERTTPDSAGERMAKVDPESRATKKTEGPATARTATSPAPAADGMPLGIQAERKKMAGTAALSAEQPAPMAMDGQAPRQPWKAADSVASAGKATSASGMRAAKEPSSDGHGLPGAGAGGDASGSIAPAGSPCGRARALAERERIREAEDAQRACLAGDLDAPSREKGLVFLAELLDRQARFSDADAVISEVDRRFPQSRPLDLYRQQRPMVQKQPKAVPVTR